MFLKPQHGQFPSPNIHLCEIKYALPGKNIPFGSAQQPEPLLPGRKAPKLGKAAAEEAEAGAVAVEPASSEFEVNGDEVFERRNSLPEFMDFSHFLGIPF